jgi:enoyl-CoA hydratase/carnithine racemase
MSAVLTPISDEITMIELTRPESYNPIDRITLDQLREYFGAPTRATVLCGSGGNFSAGADRKWLSDASFDERLRFIADMQDLLQTMEHAESVVIAAVDGVAFGGGLELLLGVDVLIADETARFKFPEVGIGAIPGVAGVQRIEALVGPRLARMMVMLAQEIDAATALSCGLATEVVAAGGAGARAREVALAAAAMPGTAWLVAKQAMVFARDLPMPAADLVARELSARVMAEGWSG